MSDSGGRLPHLLERMDAALAGLRGRDVGLVLDFDGTLAELVDAPQDAVVHPDAAAALRNLTSRLTLAAVMSGRPAADVRERVGVEGVAYIGNHGAERLVGGDLRVAADAAGDASGDIRRAMAAIRAVVDEPGMVWEDKGFSGTAHYRMVADEADVIARLESAVARVFADSRTLEALWGNKVLEIRRRGGANKGVALNALIREWGLTGVIFLGDDTTDADALRTLRRRRAEGAIAGIGVAVMQQGTPAAVIDSADYWLDGVSEVAEFLQRLPCALR